VGGGSGGALQEVDGRGFSGVRVRGELFVSDHLSELGDVLPEVGDFFGPGASGVVRVGEAGGVLAFGFGEVFEHVVEALL
jgi:hypothetical protein